MHVMKRFMIIALLSCLAFSLLSCGEEETIEGDKEDMICEVRLIPLTSEEASTLYPTGYDEEMAKEKGIIEKEINEDGYLRLQAAYLAILNEYLSNAVNLNSYQSTLDKSELNYPVMQSDIYAQTGSFGRANIYLRNNVFVERLDKADIDQIFEAINNGKLMITDDLVDIVECTWREIVTVKFEDSYTDAYKINYEMESSNGKEAMTDALTFEIMYDIEYNEDGNIPDDSYEKAKYDEVLSLAEKMEKEISEKLESNVTVFVKVN